MELTSLEAPTVRRAIDAYREAKRGSKGRFVGRTADEILEELNPTPVRWAELADFVIREVEGSRRGDR